MNVREIMDSSLATIESDSTLVDAFEKFERQSYRALLVIQSGRPQGVVTNESVVRHVLADEDEASAKPVRDAMTRRVAACFEDTDVNLAREFVQEKDLHFLLICDRDKRLIGLLPAEDLEKEAKSPEGRKK